MSGTILICAGGTGGHVFPGIAVADALGSVSDVTCVFVGTGRGLEGRIVPERGYRLELLPVSPMRGGGAVRAARGALSALRSLGAAVRILRRHRPAVVLSVGGYSAGPVSLAAALAGVPVAVLEPNAVPGFTNKLLAPFARRAYVVWEDVFARFGSRKSRMMGVPLRRGFSLRPYSAGASRRVLIVGGSLGAEALNERLPAALGLLARGGLSFEIVHQTGKDREADVRARYDRAGISRVNVVPFLDDMAVELARCDLVVARAGAITVAEIASVGRASLLVPFPFAADDHQTRNAELFASLGACRALSQEAATPARLASELSTLLEDGGLRERMARAAALHGRPDAALVVACDLIELGRLGLRTRKRSDSNGAPAPYPKKDEVH